MITWLVGPSGAGKTTIGRLLADRRGVPFHDTDEIVERDTGMSIEQIFSRDGEAAFRRHEWNAILGLVDATSAPCVVALGAGAIADAGVRELVRTSGLRAFVDIDAVTALERLERGAPRPLLFADDPHDAWTRLYARRCGYYRDSDVTIVADADPADVARRLDEALMALANPTWVIDAFVSGERTTVESFASLRMLLERSREIVGSRRAVIVTDSVLAAEYGELLRDPSLAPGSLYSIDAGERSKSFAAAERLVRAFATAGLTRDDVAVAFGGGVVCDLTGFVASVYMRGIEACYIPTTLLAQVDAAIGGKTAIDAAGVRNLAGTIRQPRHVLTSPALLRSLPAREIRSGFVEAVKMGIANRAELAEATDEAAATVIEGKIPANIDEVVRLSVATKLDVVERDARDASERLSLNFGHTFAHALEAIEPDRHAHGEAVAFGIMAASEVARRLGTITNGRHDELLSRVMPFAEPVGAAHDVGALVSAMFTDKKRTAGGLRLVLPLEGTGVEIHETTDRPLLEHALEATIERLTAGDAQRADRT